LLFFQHFLIPHKKSPKTPIIKYQINQKNTEKYRKIYQKIGKIQQNQKSKKIVKNINIIYYNLM